MALPIANKICKDDPELKQYYDPDIVLCAGGKEGNYNLLNFLSSK